MNGTIPTSIGQLSELINLNLQENSWKGVITEAQLMNLTRLEEFILTTATNQSLVFNVTFVWVPTFRLKYLELESSLIGPKFPVWLQVQSELTSVTLNNIGISETILKERFSKISSQLTPLDLSNNQIMGKLSYQLLFPNVDVVDLSCNQFRGPIPLWFTNATKLSLKRNSFPGPISSTISDLMPRYLDLSENLLKLDGTIPLSIQKLENLEILHLN